MTFKSYIQKQKDDYDDGDKTFTENVLMANGYLKHKISVKEGNYNVPTKEEQRIIALSAEFDDLKNKKANLTAQLNKNGKRARYPSRTRQMQRNGLGRKSHLHPAH